jgi:hypothetical protein
MGMRFLLASPGGGVLGGTLISSAKKVAPFRGDSESYFSMVDGAESVLI